MKNLLLALVFLCAPLMAEMKSPLEVVNTYVLPLDYTIRVKCKNVGMKEIKGAAFKVVYYDALGDEVPTLEGYKYDLSLKPGKQKVFGWADPIYIPTHRRAKAEVIKLRFADGTTWEAK